MMEIEKDSREVFRKGLESLPSVSSTFVKSVLSDFEEAELEFQEAKREHKEAMKRIAKEIMAEWTLIEILRTDIRYIPAIFEAVVSKVRGKPQ